MALQPDLTDPVRWLDVMQSAHPPFAFHCRLRVGSYRSNRRVAKDPGIAFLLCDSPVFRLTDSPTIAAARRARNIRDHRSLPARRWAMISRAPQPTVVQSLRKQ